MEDTKLYLNGRVYSGSVYFLSGCRDESEAGVLCAFCYGPSWGLHSPGTCLAYLRDASGNTFVRKELADRSGYYDAQSGIILQ